MIDQELRSILEEKHGFLNFNGLLEFMEASGIEFRARETKWPLGIATYYCVYIDPVRLKNSPDNIIFFVILHEIAHYKRMVIVGKEQVLRDMSIEDFDQFCEHVITEEIVADRYACLVFQILNKVEFPRSATQQLHLVNKQNNYRPIARQLFGVIQNNEEIYIKLLESFLV